MSKITFSKYHGTGNDFIIVDNRDGSIQLSKQQVADFCHRRFGIGADGLMLLENAPGYHFKMVYYNSDGAESSMCGNGGRCLVLFALHCGVHQTEFLFIASDGPHTATIEDNGWIRLKMKDVPAVEIHLGYGLVDTGSPHYVKVVSNLRHHPVKEEGQQIRYSDNFKRHGVNVNFVESLSEDTIFVRTYERGVEDETMSCGTGVTAAALLQAHNEYGFNHINVQTPGGKLYVEYDRISTGGFENIWLCGPAVKVFAGQLDI